jgi:hypothetical protein
MKKSIYPILALCALFAFSCTKEAGYTPFGTELIDYSNAQKGGEITVVEEMEIKNAFETTAFSVSKNDVLKAFGVKKLPDDIVFYGEDAKGKKLFGPTDYNSVAGFYFNKEGYVCSPSSADARVFVDFTLSALRFAVGQVPEACKEGDTFTLHMGLANASTYCPVEATLSLVSPGEWAVYFTHSDGLTYSVYETVKTDYTPLSVYINEEAVCGALGLASFAKLISGMNATKPTVEFYGLNADCSEYLIAAKDGSGSQAGYTANNKGHWFNMMGNVCGWRDTGWFCYSEWDGASNPIFFNIGQATTGVEAGMSTVIRQKFVHGEKEAVLTYKVHIVGKVTPDLGPDE